MKHNLLITITLIAFFVLSQVAGLYLVLYDSHVLLTTEGNETKILVLHENTSLGARPETTGAGSFIYIILGVIIGTILVLILVRFRQSSLWRLWFFVAVWIAVSIALGVFIKTSILFPYDLAMLIALILSIWKIWRPNILIHNITEVLMYAGIAVLFVPLFMSDGVIFGIRALDAVFWALLLLVVISLYDMYAVWKSKHMVKMAKFQTQSRIFAGLMIPYKQKNGTRVETKTSAVRTASAKSAKQAKVKTAILGGGDVAFPLIFSGVVMEYLMTTGLSKPMAFLEASIIIATTTIALALLFIFAKKDRFYPAMPFVTAGCLLGWIIILLL